MEQIAPTQPANAARSASGTPWPSARSAAMTAPQREEGDRSRPSPQASLQHPHTPDEPHAWSLSARLKQKPMPLFGRSGRSSGMPWPASPGRTDTGAANAELSSNEWISRLALDITGTRTMTRPAANRRAAVSACAGHKHHPTQPQEAARPCHFRTGAKDRTRGRWPGLSLTWQFREP